MQGSAKTEEFEKLKALIEEIKMGILTTQD